jgi:hypothetical protein
MRKVKIKLYTWGELHIGGRSVAVERMLQEGTVSTSTAAHILLANGGHEFTDNGDIYHRSWSEGLEAEDEG